MIWKRAVHEPKGPKVVMAGPTGSRKTRTIMAAADSDKDPRLLLIDYEDGGDWFEKDFNFSRVKIEQVISLSDPRYEITNQEIENLRRDRFVWLPMLERGQVHGVDFARVTLLDRIAKNPIDMVSVDSATVHYSWTIDKWHDIFIVREKGAGNKRDYYTLQPRDWDKIKREFWHYLARLKALQVGVFVTCHTKDKYADSSNGADFLKKIGMMADIERKLPYYMDTEILIEREEEGKAKSAEKRHDKFVAIVKKDRTHSLPGRFVWVNGEDEGHSKSFVERMRGIISWQGRVTEDLDEAAPPQDSPEREAEAIREATQSEPMATRDNLERLVYLKDKLGIATEKWRSVLEKLFDVETAKRLTKKQANSLIEMLVQKLPNDQEALAYEAHFARKETGTDADGFRNNEGCRSVPDRIGLSVQDGNAKY